MKKIVLKYKNVPYEKRGMVIMVVDDIFQGLCGTKYIFQTQAAEYNPSTAISIENCVRDFDFPPTSEIENYLKANHIDLANKITHYS